MPRHSVQNDLGATEAPSASNGSHLEAGDWQQRRAGLRAHLSPEMTRALGEDEVAAHFAGMPPHYWSDLDQADLVWELQTVHEFFTGIVSPIASGTAPVLDWRDRAEATCVLLCTWDRHGLLAKAAACFSAVNLSIRRASIFTRPDHIVLDVFHVCDSSGSGVAPAKRLKEMKFLLEGALSEPPRFASLWACSRQKFLAPPALSPPQITFDNDTGADGTRLCFEAPDRLGLLYDLLQALADFGLSVQEAEIETQEGMARDTLRVTNSAGQKIRDPEEQAAIRRAVEAALALGT